jgi:hypothetical protein
MNEEGQEELNIVEAADDKAMAAMYYMENKNNKDKMLEFFCAAGMNMLYKTDKTALQKEFAICYDKEPKKFIAAATDKFSSLKYTVKLALEFKIITSSRENGGKIMTASGTLCTPDELVEYFKKNGNMAELQDIEFAIEKQKDKI